jgi:hypothetical protein
VRLIAGDGQRAPARGTLPLPVSVRVVSRHGIAIPNAKVRFRPLDTEDAATPDTAITDEDGRARATWRFGPIPGSRSMHVFAEGIDSALVVTADAEPVASETRIVSLDTGQYAVIGSKLPRPVGIRVTDTAGRPLTDIPVTWVPLDGGSVEGLVTRTDSLGEARAEWTLANRSGVQRARAQIGAMRSVPPVVLRAHATPGGAATAWLVGGNAQKGVVGVALPKRVTIKVLDRAGNAVPGVTVRFAPARGGVADSVVMSDSTGHARATWTLDRTPGPHSLVATVEGVSRPLTATAMARAGEASAIELAPRQATGTPGKPLGDGVVATVTDEYGNAVRGATVTFKASAGTLSPARVTTDDKGRARTRWTLGRGSVEQSLTGRVSGSGASATLAVRVSLPGKPAAATAAPSKKTTPAKTRSSTSKAKTTSKRPR